MICMIAVANLNYFRPHKTTVLFWLTQLTFLASGFKYVTALMISSASHDPGATQEDIDVVGKILIAIEIFTFVSMVFGLCAAVYVLNQKLKKQEEVKKRMKRVLKSHVSLGRKVGGMFGTALAEKQMSTVAVAEKQNSTVAVAEKQNSTKVVPALPVTPDVAQPTTANETSKRLELRRQKTRALAEANRADAESADWL
jgi:hypothetical protein